MATQTTSSYSDTLQPGWSSLSGTVLEGGFELQELLEADGARARFKVRVLGDRELDCVALVFELPGLEADGQIELWKLARQLRHINLSGPLGAGKIKSEDVAAVYVIVRRADESLEGVLGERGLSADEAGEVLTSVAKALELLHLNGLVHGCLAPSRVLAVGDSIKLPSECLRVVGSPPPLTVFSPAYLAPESQGENCTIEADIWCLGATIFEALTQKPWTEQSREATGDLPEPFASVALRCLQLDASARANLGEVMALYRGELKPLPRARAAAVVPSMDLIVPAIEPAAALSPIQPLRVEVPVDSGGGSFPVTGESTPIVPVARELHAMEEPLDAAAIPDTARRAPDVAISYAGTSGRSSFDEAIGNAAPRRRSEIGDDSDDEPSTNLWIWASLTLLVVLGLIWALRPKASPRKVSDGSAASVNAGPPKAPVSPAGGRGDRGNTAWETRTLQPDGSAAVAAGSHANAVPGAVLWRVVAFTYAHRPDAEKKAHYLAAKHPNLHPEVFLPSGSGGPYLVVLGGRMGHEDAAQLRRNALNEGLPRDSYIQNYTR